MMLSYGFREFPGGSCGDASLLLGTFIKDETGQRSTYVLGYLGQRSHAWIEMEGIIVDITADQFSDVTHPVMVSIDPGWHSQFQNREFFEADYRLQNAADELGRSYLLIRAAMKSEL